MFSHFPELWCVVCLLSDASEPSHLNHVISAWLQTNIKADNQTHADMDIVDRACIAVCLSVYYIAIEIDVANSKNFEICVFVL